MTYRDVLRRREPVIVYTGRSLRAFAAVFERFGLKLPEGAKSVRGVMNAEGGREWSYSMK